jgi:hypothetical protein
MKEAATEAALLLEGLWQNDGKGDGLDRAPLFVSNHERLRNPVLAAPNGVSKTSRGRTYCHLPGF